MNKMHGYTEVGTNSVKGVEVDIESGETLYPGLSKGENQLRWGFIRKVYGILAAQMVLTTLISFVTVLYAPINDLLKGSPGILLFFAILPLICKYPNTKTPYFFNSINLIFMCIDLGFGVFDPKVETYSLVWFFDGWLFGTGFENVSDLTILGAI